MLKQEDNILWHKIESFQLDKEGAVTTFSAKLAEEQKWTAAFTKSAIEEYRKFIFLCCIAEDGATPSKIVDEVWHLHLTYTQSYWIDFCRNTLERDIHHYPSTGGEEEDEKYRELYAITLQRYYETFGTYPPSDIWPPPRTILPPVKKNKLVITVAILIAVLPALLLLWLFGKLSPFELDGQQFLLFYIIYAGTLILAKFIYLRHIRMQIDELIKTYFPLDVNPFQVAHFLYGKHRGVQTAIIDLLKRGFLYLDDKNTFVISRNYYLPDDLNPLLPGLAQCTVGNAYSYDLIMAGWYEPVAFVHPSLEALDRLRRREQSAFVHKLFNILLYGVPFLRLLQGWFNNKPVGYLVMEILITFVLLAVGRNVFYPRFFMHKQSSELYRSRLDSNSPSLLQVYALTGITAVYGFAEIVALRKIFPANGDTISGFPYDDHNWHSDSGGSGGSCSSSSCGGGSCGGGGCGGCGGGH